jgi:hypothetical protein
MVHLSQSLWAHGAQKITVTEMRESGPAASRAVGGWRPAAGWLHLAAIALIRGAVDRTITTSP